MLLEELEQIGGQCQIVAQRLHLSLRGNCKDTEKQLVFINHHMQYLLVKTDGVHLGDLPAALKSSSGGCTPVRQLKNRAAQRRKGSMPFFTLSATELPDTSGFKLTSKAQNNVSKMEFLLVQSRVASLSLTQLKIAKLAVINNLILNLLENEWSI